MNILLGACIIPRQQTIGSCALLNVLWIKPFAGSVNRCINILTVMNGRGFCVLSILQLWILVIKLSTYPIMFMVPTYQCYLSCLKQYLILEKPVDNFNNQ